MSKKVYLIREDYYPEGTEMGLSPETAILGVYGNLANAEKAIGEALDDLYDGITGGDENDASRVSFMFPWDGRSASIGDECCAVWKLTIEFREIKDEQ